MMTLKAVSRPMINANPRKVAGEESQTARLEMGQAQTLELEMLWALIDGLRSPVKS